MTQSIIIDTDPGQDDAIAIALALSAPDRLNVLGITTVAGNVSRAQTTRNALATLELCGRPDMPVHPGAPTALDGQVVHAEHVHGPSGLDGYTLPEPSIAARTEDAVSFLRRMLMWHPPGSITICCLGPLTNIARLIELDPAASQRAARLVIMGGAHFEVGNISPAAEFNFFVDPEAAECVLGSGLEVVMIPLDVTHQLLLTEARKREIARIGTPVAQAILGWVDYFERYDREKYSSDGAPVHDPAVIAYMLAPELFDGRFVNVSVETQSPLTRGMSVVDWWRVTDRPANTMVMGKVDADGFFALLTHQLLTAAPVPA